MIERMLTMSEIESAWELSQRGRLMSSIERSKLIDERLAQLAGLSAGQEISFVLV